MMQEVRMHFFCSMSSSDKDPINSGSMGSWFHYYKWKPLEEDEVFFPFEEDELPNIQQGDVLWFVVDESILGGAHVLRVMPAADGRKEVWYRTNAVMLPRTTGHTMKMNDRGLGKFNESQAKALLSFYEVKHEGTGSSEDARVEGDDVPCSGWSMDNDVQ